MKWIYSRIVLSTIWLLIVNLIGCSEDDGFTPPAKRAKTLIGYGLAWSWHAEDFGKLARGIASTGANATVIEIDGKASIDTVARFVGEMRKVGVTTEIIVLNGNAVALLGNPDSWFYVKIDQLISKVGYDKVILQPICEPGNRGGDLNKMRRWMKYGYDKWKGQTAAPNKWIGPEFHRGRTYIEKHICKENESFESLTTTDCTPLIDIAPDRVYNLVRRAIRENKNFIYYHANFNSINTLKMDQGKLDAIKRAIQES